MVPGIFYHLAELVDDQLGSGIGRVAHGHVDDVDPVASLGIFERVDGPEEVGRQTVHPLAESNNIF